LVALTKSNSMAPDALGMALVLPQNAAGNPPKPLPPVPPPEPAVANVR
jgi:hypothetical protein